MWQMNVKLVLSGSLWLLKRLGVSQFLSDLFLQAELCGFFQSDFTENTNKRGFFNNVLPQRKTVDRSDE